MPNKMLIDATHPEETRVVVLRGNRVEEFDFESANRKQLRGNIYLAKVTRVEPSLQAAFVDYGGNRHGFLAFSEIHPDYYQIPVADRQALIAEEERAQRAADAEADSRAGRRSGRRERSSTRPRDEVKSEPLEASDEIVAMAAGCEETMPQAGSAEQATEPGAPDEAEPRQDEAAVQDEALPTAMAAEPPIELAQLESSAAAEPVPGSIDTVPADAGVGSDATAPAASAESGETAASSAEAPAAGNNITEVNGHGAETEEEAIESVGGADAMEEVPERMPRLRRQYKIQEVIKRRQVMLVQVVKEERGTKGAALTTYLSLAGRYSVLMPNTARGGGISRKITSAEDRRKLKEIAQELEVPEGMGVILRTAGAARTKTEVKRDFEYLLRLWETVRDLTLKSTAPTLVYEEGSLVKRSIRDLYNKDIDEIIVAGEDGHQDAKEFMRMLMPSHAKNVKLYRDTLPVFTRFGIESQLDAMFSPVMQLKSGGYIVLNQAEALVAIDVNSGRATREHHIEDTALKTNMEAAEEIARQLRLRDLAGLIVIDFIDMDEKRNNRAVERRLKECLRHDRARIQVGHISHFGLLEMSRQRIRSSVLESSTEKCSHCGGTGHMRSVSSVALQLLRSLEEMLLKGATHNLIVRTRAEIALYLLNHKRAHLRALEERFRITIMVNADAAIGGQLSFVIEKGEQVHSPEQAKALALQAPAVVPAEPEDEEDDEDVEEAVEAEEDEAAAEPEEARAEGERAEGERADGERGGRKRRRRRRGRRGEGRDGGAFQPERDGAFAQDRNGGDIAREDGAFPNDRIEHQDAAAGDEGHIEAEGENGQGAADAPGEARGDGERRRRRRGRRGGRRNRRDREGEAPFASDRGRAGEPELNRVAADFDDGPATEPLHEQPIAREPFAEPQRDTPPPTAVEPQDERPAPVAMPALPDAIAPAPEPPRRRSTVREPAPVGLTGEAAAPAIAQPAEPPLPVVSGPTESEDSDRPRRSGWWSKRALGKG
ncbi:MAG TPA: Rne/Rng family ribonuclease [Xanthobacteraceae bacterium]|nr:Rne/Rng family ribonuclease [Xanthobacteraceae bacterium]